MKITVCVLSETASAKKAILSKYRRASVTAAFTRLPVFRCGLSLDGRATCQLRTNLKV